MSRTEETAEGAGPFTTRLTWHLDDGSTAVWESRRARKRGLLTVLAAGETEARSRSADTVSVGRLRTLNAVAAGAFAVGGGLFVLGAAVAQFGPVDATGAWIYFAGGLCFNAGGYASLLQAVNAPRQDSTSASLATRHWRWWSYEPGRIDWLSTFLLFVGTLVFGVNLVGSLLQGLSVQQENELVWAPDLIGCTIFLVSGHLALVEVCHGRPRTPTGSRLVDRRGQPTRLGSLHGLGTGRLHPPRHGKRPEHRHRRLGHSHGSALLLRRRGAAVLRTALTSARPAHEKPRPTWCLSRSHGVPVLWRRQGSNLGRLSRQIYSLLPLATRAHRLERRLGSREGSSATS